MDDYRDLCLYLSLALIAFSLLLTGNTYSPDEGFYARRAVQFVRDPWVLFTTEGGFGMSHPPLLATVTGMLFMLFGRNIFVGKFAVTVVHIFATITLCNIVGEIAKDQSRSGRGFAQAFAVIVYVSNGVILNAGTRLLTDSLVASFTIFGIWHIIKGRQRPALVSFVLAALSRNLGGIAGMIPLLNGRKWEWITFIVAAIVLVWVARNQVIGGTVNRLHPTGFTPQHWSYLLDGAFNMVRGIGVAVTILVLLSLILDFHKHEVMGPLYRYIAFFAFVVTVMYPWFGFFGAPPVAIARYYAPLVPVAVIIASVMVGALLDIIEWAHGFDKAVVYLLIVCVFIGYNIYATMEKVECVSNTSPNIDAVTALLKDKPGRVIANGNINRQLKFFLDRDVHELPNHPRVMVSGYDYLITMNADHTITVHNGTGPMLTVGTKERREC